MLNSDWQRIGTLDELNQYIGMNTSLKIGWNESITDTILVQIVSPSIGEPLPPVRYCMNVWNRPGVRSEVAALLGYPVSRH